MARMLVMTVARPNHLTWHSRTHHLSNYDLSSLSKTLNRLELRLPSRRCLLLFGVLRAFPTTGSARTYCGLCGRIYGSLLAGWRQYLYCEQPGPLFCLEKFLALLFLNLQLTVVGVVIGPAFRA